MFAVDVDVRHRAFEIAQKITEGSITRLDYVDNSKLIFETANCLKHLHEALGYAEDDAAGLEAELEGVQVGASKLESENNALKNWQASLEQTIKLQEADIEYFKAIADGKDYVPTILLKESEKQLVEANNKIAVQAQKIVELRRHLGDIRQDNDGLSALAEREAGRVDEFQVSELQVSSLVSENNSLTQTIEDLRAENARLKAAGAYLRKPRRSYLKGAVSAVGDVVRLVVGGGR